MKSYNKIRLLLAYSAKTMFILLVCLQLLSCKKYLDKKRNNQVVSPSTIEDIQAMLDEGRTMNEINSPAFGEASTTDYFLQPTTYTSRQPRFQQVYIWKPYEYIWQNDWSWGYAPVLISNLCLELLEKIPMTSQNEIKWKNIKGSALFFRAYNFLNLTWNYAKAYDESSYDTDLGIALRLSSDFNVPSVRANVKECYDRIIADAKDAMQYLDVTPAHVYRPSKPAVYGLLARAYLSMRKYDSAYKYSDLCLGIRGDLFNYNTLPVNPNSTSPAFSQYKYNLNNEIIFYTEMNVTMGSLIATSAARIDTTLYSSYANNDRRQNVFFGPSGQYRIFKGSYSGSAIFFTGIAVNEMLLIRAECKARGINGNSGDKTAALVDLNTLLEKRYNATFVPYDAIDATDALNKILQERRKELLMRGLRWIDIKRLNKEGRNIELSRLVNGQPYSLLPNANYYALPLPTDIINITSMPQNPN